MCLGFQELRSREEELTRAALQQKSQEELLKRREQQLAEREINVLERELNILIFQLNKDKPNVKKRKGKFKRSRLKLKDGNRISLPSGEQTRTRFIFYFFYSELHISERQREFIIENTADTMIKTFVCSCHVLQTFNTRSPCRHRLPWTRGVASTAPAPLLPAVPRSSPDCEPFSVGSVSSSSPWLFCQVSMFLFCFMEHSLPCEVRSAYLNMWWLKESHQLSGSFMGTEHGDSIFHNDRSHENKRQSCKQSASCLNSDKTLVTHQRPCNNWSKFLLCISAGWRCSVCVGCCRVTQHLCWPII